MKAKEGVVNYLNAILTNELTAINQYFVHAEMCESWGYHRLYEQLRGYSLNEMKDVERLIEHILYLEGLPNLQRLGTVAVGENVLEDLKLNLEQEQRGNQTYVEAIAHCAQVGDFNTRRLLEEMIAGGEEQIDWLETQLETINQVGLQNYLAQQMHGE